MVTSPAIIDESSKTRARGPRWRRILFLQLLFSIAGIVVLELGTRAWLWMHGTPYHSSETRGTVAHFLELNRRFAPRTNEPVSPAPPQDPSKREDRTLHPYLGWELEPDVALTEQEYRWLRSGSDSDTMLIVVLGGSVAAGFMLPTLGWDRLREVLRSDPRVAARVLHPMMCARAGFKQPQQLNFLVYLLALGFRPEVVINLDGFNEVALGNNNHAGGTNPVFPSAAHWGHLAEWNADDHEALERVAEIRGVQRSIESWGNFDLDWHVDHSAIAGQLVVHRMYKLRVELADQFTSYAQALVHNSRTEKHGPKLPGDELEAVKASVECWKQSSRSIADLCRARGILYLHVLQPTLHDTGSKPLTAKEIENGGATDPWLHGVQLGYPLLRAAGEELSREGVHFLDASQAFADQHGDLYYDCCHFVNPGHEILAEKIGSEVLRLLPQSSAALRVPSAGHAATKPVSEKR